MHAAKLKTSPRLQRVDQLLADGREYSTMEIINACQVCAVNSIIAELRENGRQIDTRYTGAGDGRVCYYHRVNG